MCVQEVGLDSCFSCLIGYGYCNRVICEETHTHRVVHNCFLWRLDERVLLNLMLRNEMVFWVVLYRFNCMIISVDCIVYKCGNFIWIYQCLCIFLPKESIFLIREYVLYIPVCPWRLHELTEIVKTKDLGTVGTLKDLSESCIIMHSVFSLMVNLLLTEGIYSVLWMCSQCASCCWRHLMSWISISRIFLTSVCVVLGMGAGGNSSNSVHPNLSLAL